MIPQGMIGIEVLTNDGAYFKSVDFSFQKQIIFAINFMASLRNARKKEDQ